jgi:hypothetical protein
MKKKWFCPEHQFGTNGPRGWGAHKLEHHNGQDPIATVKGLKEPEGREAIGQAVSLLRKERYRMRIQSTKLTSDLERLESAIRILARRKAKS